MEQAGTIEVEVVFMVVVAQVKVSCPPGHGRESAMSLPSGPSLFLAPIQPASVGHSSLLGEGSPPHSSPSLAASLGCSWQRLASPAFPMTE